jgi:hypothetical protein
MFGPVEAVSGRGVKVGVHYIAIHAFSWPKSQKLTDPLQDVIDLCTDPLQSVIDLFTDFITKNVSDNF